MTKKLNIGLIGCGKMGSIYCKLLKNLSAEDKRISFAGVFDINEEVASKAAKEFGVKSYGSCKFLLNNIDALFIVTPTVTHFEIAKDALEKGVNLFIEKPVTAKLKEAEELIRMSNESKVKVQVGHVERFNPAVLLVEKFQLLPMFIEAHRLAQFNPRGTDVTVIHDLMIHDIDIILNLVKSPVGKVDASGVAVISDSIDIASARIKFTNGCVANLTASRISLKKMRKMRIFQKNAYITLDFLENKAQVFRLLDSRLHGQPGKVIPISESKSVIFEEMQGKGDDNPMANEIRAYVDSIVNDKPVKVTLEDAQRALHVGENIVRIISRTI
jgi:predicted dehydrogenase